MEYELPLAEHTLPLAEHRRPTKEEEENKGTGSTFKIRGSTKEYRAARLARDAPDVLERMKAGEYPSVRAAARAAGVLKESTLRRNVEQRGMFHVEHV